MSGIDGINRNGQETEEVTITIGPQGIHTYLPVILARREHGIEGVKVTQQENGKRVVRTSHATRERLAEAVKKLGFNILE